MRIYVAGSWSRRKDAEQVGKDLKLLGHSLTHEWWNVETDSAQEDPSNASEFAEMACNDLVAVDRADCVVVLVTNKTRREATYETDGAGTLVEMGAALACGKPVVRICIDGGTPPVRNIFDHLCVDVDNFAALAEACASIEEFVIASEATEDESTGSDDGAAQEPNEAAGDEDFEDPRTSSGLGVQPGKAGPSAG